MDGDNARLLEGAGDRLVQGATVRDQRVGSVGGKGGWSSQRYSRSVGKEQLEHVRHAAHMLCEHDRERRYQRILVGTSSVLFSELERLLDQEVRGRIIGRFDAGADWESAGAIADRIEPLLKEDETRREREVLEHLPLSGVRGWVKTLPALYERRVRWLLLEPGLEQPGIVCPRCRWAAPAEEGFCPVDGQEMRPHPNLAEWAVEAAVEQDAGVIILRHHDDLHESDGVAAVRRF
jgi:hypothetical protein